MYQVCFIAQDDQFGSDMGNTLRRHFHDRLIPFSTLHQNPSQGRASSPLVLIVDLQGLSPALARCVDQIIDAHENALIIPIAALDRRASFEGLANWGVDEVLPRPQEDFSQDLLVERIMQRLNKLNRLSALQEKLRKKMGESQIVAKSKPLRELMQQLPALADSSSTVLITGETGTGKEVIARAIHYLGPRSDQPFVTVDCGAIPEHLIENELFGHARGAYTNAAAPAKGLIAEANGGTLFLDEVEALPLGVQSKFLRFLQERQFRPLGQTQYLRANVRILAATNVELARAVAQNLFRADLYYRLNVVLVTLPALRERKADLPALVDHFLRRYARDGEPHREVPAELMKAWLSYHWPGNVRELENKVQSWLTLQSETPETGLGALPRRDFLPLAEVRRQALDHCERAYLQNLIEHTNGNISAAARIAGMHRKNLSALLKKFGLKRPESSSLDM